MKAGLGFEEDFFDSVSVSFKDACDLGTEGRLGERVEIDGFAEEGSKLCLVSRDFLRSVELLEFLSTVVEVLVGFFPQIGAHHLLLAILIKIGR